MGEEIGFENRRISDFEGLMTSGHTAYRHASLIDLYLHTKFHWNQRNLFVDGRTYGRTYVWTGGLTFETHFISRLGGVDLKIKLVYFYMLDALLITITTSNCKNTKDQKMGNGSKMILCMHVCSTKEASVPNSKKVLITSITGNGCWILLAKVWNSLIFN